MDDQTLIISDLSRFVYAEGMALWINIARLEGTPEWSLELVDPSGTSLAWEEPFWSDQVALAEALRAIEDDGIGLFRVVGDIVQKL